MYKALGLGGAADDGTGDSLRVGGGKINENFVELYAVLGDGTTLISNTGLSCTTSTVTLTSPVFAGTITGSYTLTSPTIATNMDLNGSELILDGGDTSITADTEDKIDFKIAGADSIIMTAGIIEIKKTGAQAELKLYSENASPNYASIQAPTHANLAGGNVVLTLPATAGTIATTDEATAMAIALG